VDVSWVFVVAVVERRIPVVDGVCPGVLVVLAIGIDELTGIRVSQLGEVMVVKRLLTEGVSLGRVDDGLGAAEDALSRVWVGPLRPLGLDEEATKQPVHTL